MRNTPAELRQALQQRMAERGMSKVELATQTSYTQAHITKLLSGSSTGSLESWTRLLDAVGLDLVVMDRRGD